MWYYISRGEIMDNIKIGKFIKELRLEKGYSQEDLAGKLYISRQSISKWENGQTAPSMSIMIRLAEIFDVTVTEIMTGERAKTKQEKEITSTASNEMIKMHKETKKIRKISVIIIFVLLFTFLGYYFFSSYRSQQIYSISGESENFTVENGLLVTTKSNAYISIQNVISDESIKSITLYYLDNEIRNDIYTKEKSNSIFVPSFIGYNENINYKNLKSIINNLYLEIKSEKYTENIKLDFRKIYENDELIKLDKPNVVENNEVNHEIDNDQLIEKIKDKFKKSKNNYTYSIKNKTEQIEIYYNIDINNLYINKYDDNYEYYWTYDLNNKNVLYEKIEINSDETVEQFQENLKMNNKFIIDFYEIVKEYILDSN